MNACRCSGLARPSSFLAFVHDSLRRGRTTRVVSRQHNRPKRPPPPPAQRRHGPRGAGSGPSRGGGGARRWGRPAPPPGPASPRGGKKGGGRPGAGPRSPPRGPGLRVGEKKGRATAGAAERERVGAALVIGGHPAQHGVGPPARAPGHLGGAAVLGDVEEGEGPLARAGLRRIQGPVAQVLRRLTPARVVNSYHEP